MDACVVGEQDLKVALQSILPSLGYLGSTDDFISYWFEKDSNINHEVFGIVDQLNAIPGVELFVATGQEHQRASYLWNELGFSSHFEKIFYSASVGHLKNNSNFFEVINSELGLIERGEIPLFFDDSDIVVGVSRKAGWDGVIFNAIDDLRCHAKIEALLKNH
jgi:putative hydrolase of the HAD superfamily